MLHIDTQKPDVAWLTISDGYKLSLTYILTPRPRAVLVLYPAMGILQRYSCRPWQLPTTRFVPGGP